MSNKIQVQAILPSQWDETRLKAILRKMRNRRILIVGDIGVDRYTVGSVSRISPEAPVPIIAVERERLKLGLAANVADNVRALGGQAQLLGVIGRDRTADDLRKLCVEAHLSAKLLVVDPSRRTILKERLMTERQQLLRVDYESEGGISAAAEDEVVRRARLAIKDCDAVVLEDYSKGLFSLRVAKSIVSIASEQGKLLAVDPHDKSEIQMYHGATVLKPNLREAEGLSGVRIRDQGSLAEAGRRILDTTGARHLVITLGKDGMALFSADTTVVSLMPTYARDVYDVSGAGDTVISVLTLALAAGASWTEACILGNVAGGIVVGKWGTVTVAPEEIQAVLETVCRPTAGRPTSGRSTTTKNRAEAAERVGKSSRSGKVGKGAKVSQER